MKPLVFVTGGTGFVGSHLVESLISRNYNVRCLIRRSSNLQWVKDLPVELVNGSLEHPDRIIPHLKDVKYVFHVAGLTKAKRNRDYFTVNAEMTRNLLDSCLAAETEISRFIYCSSQAAAGPGSRDSLRNETTMPEPVSLYGKSKLEGEWISKSYMSKLPVTIVRPPAVYGPRDTDIFKFFKMVNSGIFPVLGKAERYYNFIYVKDLAEAIIDTAEKETANGNIYYLVDPDIYSWSQIADEISNALNKKPSKITVPAGILAAVSIFSEIGAKLIGKPALLNRDKIKEINQQYWTVSADNALKDIGYKINYPLKKGISETAAWYKENGWLR